MRAPLLDPRVLGPAAVAAALFSFRALPAPATPPPPPPRALALPPVHGMPPAQRRVRYELDACSLPGHPLRLSGHGTVDAASLGLPSRSWFHIVSERHRITLGLDLAWSIVRDR